MKKLVALREFLTGLALWDDNKMASIAEDITVTPRAKGGPEGLNAGDIVYQVLIVVDRYEYTRYPIESLIVNLAFWLLEEDDNRDDLEDPLPEIGIAVMDDKTADLEISLWFKESIYLVADKSGDIEAFGYTWKLEQPELLVAENLLGVNSG